jgi:hypothetical protein
LYALQCHRQTPRFITAVPSAKLFAVKVGEGVVFYSIENIELSPLRDRKAFLTKD